MRVLLLGISIAAILFSGACGSNADQTPAKQISGTELAERVEAGSAPLVLDVRTREEFARGHIPGAINLPHDELSTRLAELPAAKSDEVVVHCQRGGRARHAGGVLREAGYTNVRDLAGHWKAWTAARRKEVARPGSRRVR